MKRILLLGGALAIAGASLLDVSRAHGGMYRGPGDTVPPGGGGGGGGGTGPSSGGPSSPGTGGPTGPSTPTPSGGGPSTGGGPARPTGGATGALVSGPDLTTWESWWGFNKEQYLNLKAHIHQSTNFTDDGFFTGGTKSRDTLRPSEETIRSMVVPALREVLAAERANDIVTGALIALAKIGDVRDEDGKSEFEPLIARFLTDPSQEIAETAAIALGILANDASIPALQSLALDTLPGRKLVGTTEVPYRTRAFAAYGLGLIAANTGSNESRQRVVRILIDVLASNASATRDVHVAAISALGLAAVDVDPGESPEGVADAGNSRQAQIRFLQRYWRNQMNNSTVRAHVPAALARLLRGAPAELRESVAKDLLAALATFSKERDEVRMSCVLALGVLGDSDADAVDVEIRAALQRMAKEGDVQSRNFVHVALGQIGGRTGTGAQPENGRRETRDFLLAQMAKGPGAVKPWAALGLGVQEHALTLAGVEPGSANATVKDQLRRALADAVRPEHVGAYSIALGIAGDVEARGVLATKFAETSEANARGYVAIGLGLVDARESIPDIQKVVRESKYKPDLLKSAAIGLGLLGDKELVPYLCDMLTEAKGLSSQAAIASALGFIGDSRSIDPLVGMLKRKQGLTDVARGFAAVALGIVADKEMLPWNAKYSIDVNYRASTSTLTGENGTGVLDIL